VYSISINSVIVAFKKAGRLGLEIAADEGTSASNALPDHDDELLVEIV